MEDTDSSIRIGNTAVLVHVIGLAALAISLCSFSFIDASTPDDRQPAFVLGGVTFAAFLGMMIWSVVLCVRSILRHENSVWSVGVLYAMFIEGIVAILIHYS